MTTYNNVLDVFSYAAHTLANTLWSERALNLSVKRPIKNKCASIVVKSKYLCLNPINLKRWVGR